jgi:YVTN family beta-propeller protein
MGLAMTRDGSRLFVSTGRGGAVAEIDTRAARLVRVIEKVGPRPWGVALSPDEGKLYVASGPSDEVAIIDVRSGAVTRRVAVGRLPWGIAVSQP